MKSIQMKLTVTILAIFLVALSLLAGLNYWKARDIITQNITRELQLLAGTSAGDIGDWLESRRAELNVMGADPVVQSGNKAAIVPFLANVAKSNKAYDGIGYVSPDGIFIGSSGATGNVTDRDYFPRAMNGEGTISDPLLSKATGHLVAVVVVPVKTDGKVTGALLGTVDMGSLSQKVMDTKIGQTGYIYLVQKSGLVIVHPDKELAMKVNLLTDTRFPPALQATSQKVVKGEPGFVRYEYNGMEKFQAYAPVPGMSWAVAATVPVAEVTGAVSSLTTISLVTIIVVLVISAVIVAWVARRIAQPIRILEAAANRVAGGDITLNQIRIDSDDEVGRLGASFEEMTGNLRDLIQKILGATGQVAASSEELTASAEQSTEASRHIAETIDGVATGATAQMDAADEAVLVVEQMSRGIQQIAVNVGQAAVQSDQAAEKARDGGKAVEKAVSQMGQIEHTVNTSAKVVAKLGERSQEIGQIVETIGNIAGQTNLLALNAAIEAARAGEQGRGFAVVAEEVRKLAEQSQEAAKKIAGLIGEIQGDTDQAVEAMNVGAREVLTGAAVVNAAGVAFQELTNLVNQVSCQVKETAGAIDQMAAGSQQIVGSVQRMDGLSKKSASEAQNVSAATEEQMASMEEITSSSQALAALAQDLQEAVAKFRVN